MRLISVVYNQYPCLEQVVCAIGRSGASRGSAVKIHVTGEEVVKEKARALDMPCVED